MDGRKFEGEMSNGKWIGSGKLTLSDGNEYLGQISGFEFHGVDRNNKPFSHEWEDYHN